MRTVADLLKRKGHAVQSIAPDTDCHTAARTMSDKGVGSLVVEEGGELVGIISERDIVRHIAREGVESYPTTPVEAVMTRYLHVVKPDDEIAHCMHLMTGNRIRHLPVMNDHGLQGIVSIGDIVKAMMEEQSFIIEQLANYISGVPDNGQD